MIGLLPKARILSPLPLQTGHSPQLLINHIALKPRCPPSRPGATVSC